MNSVKSADGTMIAVDRTGTGPALVVVVGAFCDRHSKKSLAAAVAGAIAIAAAAAGVEVRKIATYEVPFTQGPSFELADQLAALVDSGDRGEAVERFLKLVGTPPEAIDGMKQGPSWPYLQSFAATLPIDVRLSNDGRIPHAQLAKVSVPLLAIAGDRGPWAVNVANAIAAAAPKGESRILAGYGHDVPDAVLSDVIATFFD